MKIINKIKNSVENTFGNELLGTEEIDKPEEKKEPPKVKKKPKKNEKKSFFERVKSQPETKPSLSEKVLNKKEKPKDDVLKSAYSAEDIYNNIQDFDEEEIIHAADSGFEFLGLTYKEIPEGIIRPIDIDQVEFDLIAPTGLDPNQVENFLNQVEKDIKLIYEIIETNKNGFNLAIKEYKQLESKYIAKRQEVELANIFNESKSEEDRLRNEIFDLRLEIQELKTMNDNLKRELKEVKYERPHKKVKEEVRELPKIPIKKKTSEDAPTVTSKATSKETAKVSPREETAEDIFNSMMEEFDE